MATPWQPRSNVWEVNCLLYRRCRRTGRTSSADDEDRLIHAVEVGVTLPKQGERNQLARAHQRQVTNPTHSTVPLRNTSDRLGQLARQVVPQQIVRTARARSASLGIRVVKIGSSSAARSLPAGDSPAKTRRSPVARCQGTTDSQAANDDRTPRPIRCRRTASQLRMDAVVRSVGVQRRLIPRIGSGFVGEGERAVLAPEQSTPASSCVHPADSSRRSAVQHRPASGRSG